MHRVFSVSEHNHIMPQQIAFLDQISPLEFLLDIFEIFLCIFTIVELVMITCFQIGSENRFGVVVLIACQDFKGNIEVFHFVVAKGDVDINGFELPALQQKFLIDLCCFFVMAPQVVDGG